jgi:hypothetical protein
MPPSTKSSDHSGSSSEARPTPPPDDGTGPPEVTRGQRTAGWGDHPDDERDDEWYRQERPPHHG